MKDTLLMKNYRLIIIIAVLSAAIARVYAGPVREMPSETLDTVYVDAHGCSAPGRYMWVPDSLAGDLERVMRGRSEIVPRVPEPENDLVIVDGDTVSQIIKSRNLGRFDRGLFNYLFIPKGRWQLGVTASYGKFKTEDLDILSLVSNLDLDISSFAIRPYVSYFIRNNLSAGMRFGYTNSKARVHSLDVDFDEDLNFSLDNVYYNNESYTAAFFTRQYYGLGRQGRFGVFNEMELAFSSGNADFHRAYDGKPKTTHSTYMSASLNFSPGLCVFIMDNVSFNISLGVFGFKLRNEKQRTSMDNPEDAELYPDETGSRFTSGANFRFNIFNINFGLGIHL